MAKKDKRIAPELSKSLEQAVEISQEIQPEEFELSPREMRLRLSENKEKIENIDHREEFRKYFIQLRTKLKLDSSLEEILWLHLRAIGCNKKEMFKNGLENYGIIGQ